MTDIAEKSQLTVEANQDAIPKELQKIIDGCLENIDAVLAYDDLLALPLKDAVWHSLYAKYSGPNVSRQEAFDNMRGTVNAAAAHALTDVIIDRPDMAPEVTRRLRTLPVDSTTKEQLFYKLSLPLLESIYVDDTNASRVYRSAYEAVFGESPVIEVVETFTEDADGSNKEEVFLQSPEQLLITLQSPNPSKKSTGPNTTTGRRLSHLGLVVAISAGALIQTGPVDKATGSQLGTNKSTPFSNLGRLVSDKEISSALLVSYDQPENVAAASVVKKILQPDPNANTAISTANLKSLERAVEALAMPNAKNQSPKQVALAGEAEAISGLFEAANAALVDQATQLHQPEDKLELIRSQASAADALVRHIDVLPDSLIEAIQAPQSLATLAMQEVILSSIEGKSSPELEDQVVTATALHTQLTKLVLPSEADIMKKVQEAKAQVDAQENGAVVLPVETLLQPISPPGIETPPAEAQPTPAPAPEAPAPASEVMLNIDQYKGGNLTRANLEKFQANMDAYLQVAKEKDIPWAVIAAIHYREFRLKTVNPGNGQGIYQFVNQDGGPYPAGEVSKEEFIRQTGFAADFIKMKARTKNNEDMRNLTINADPEVVKDTFFSWNGRAVVYMNQAHSLGFKFGRDGSPYVMNKYDDLRNPDKNPSGWGQVKRDHGPIEYSANDDAGAFVIYRELMELAGTPIGDASGVRLELPAPPAVAPKTQEEIDCDNKMSKEVSDVKRGLMDKYNCVSGKLEPSELAALGGPWGDNSINPIGLEGFKGLAAAYQAEFGKPLKVNDSYRSYDEQVQTKAKKVKEGKPNEAASPGKSTHGWGFALDLGDGIERFDSPQHKWMKENAHKFGWIHPAWAEPNGSAPEAWHWEFAGPQEAPQPSAQAQPQANKNTAPTTPEVEIKPSTNPSPTPPTTDDKKADDKKKSNAPEDNPKTNDNADKKDQKPQDNDKQNKQNDNKFWDLLSFGD